MRTRPLAPVGVALLVALAGCGAIGPGLLPGDTPTATTGNGGARTATATATPAVPTPGSDEGALVTVVGVESADRLNVQYENGTRVSVSLAGVAAPRSSGENDPADYEGVPDVDAAEECLAGAGEDALSHTRDAVRGEQIRIVRPANVTGTDERRPVFAFTGGRLFNIALVRDGDARAVESGVEYADEFLTAETAARDAARGLWRCTEVETPTAGQTDTPTATPTPVSETGIRVVEVSAEVTGGDLNEEYVVIKNTGELPVDLSGWRIRDGDGNTYTFGEGPFLEGNESVRLYTGGGEQTDSERYWWRSEEVWDDDGETITIFNDNGDKVYERTYD